MENILRKELELQQLKLTSTMQENSWWKYLGMQSKTIEQKYRQQCVKELEKLLLNRQQLDQTMKNNSTVKL